MFRPLRSLPSLQCKLVSRSRAFRSKRHAAGTSPAHKWRSFQNFTFYWCRKKLENFEFRKNSKLRLIRNAKEKDVNLLANLCAQLGYPAASSDIAARLEKLRHNPKLSRTYHFIPVKIILLPDLSVSSLMRQFIAMQESTTPTQASGLLFS